MAVRQTSVGSLEIEISKLLEGYTSDAKNEIYKGFQKIGKDSVKALKKTSPKRTGAYRKGWTSKAEQFSDGCRVRVYNKNRYQLTHLLEYGHQKRGGKGRVSAVEHIKPVNDQAQKDVEKLIKEAFG